MAQEGYDRLMALTDSRYRLSMIVARRAAQLKGGVPTVLADDERPDTANTVTIAMHELRRGVGVHWGDDLPSWDELRRHVVDERRREEPSFTVSRADLFSDDD